MSEETVVDARGLACPLPVVKTKDAVEKAAFGARILVRVDNETARDNVLRLVAGKGCLGEASGEAPDIRVTITVGTAPAAACGTTAAPGGPPRVVAFVNKELMGHGAEELGRILMRAFLQTLKDVDPRPEAVIFVNAGVRLTTGDSALVPVLQDLEKKGLKIVSCGTCLDYFKVMDRLRVGVASNMYEIVTLLANADRVIAP